MAVFSKCLPTSDFTCYDVCHPWTPSCTYAASEVGWSALMNGLKVYASVYLMSSVVQGKIFNPKRWGKLSSDILRSSIFLSANSGTFIAAICCVRWILKRFFIPSVAFIPAFIASIISIFIERPSRRQLLAVYMVNIATDMIYRALISRGLLQVFPHQEVLLFSFTMSIFLYFYKKRDHSRDLTSAILSFIIGPKEGGAPPKSKRKSSDISGGDDKEKQQKRTTQLQKILGFLKSLPTSLLKSNKFLLSLQYQLHVLNATLQQGYRHNSCLHETSCAYYSVTGFLRPFLYGVLAQSALIAVTKKWKRDPKVLWQMIKAPQNLRLGLFLGLFSGSFKMINCILRRINNRDAPVHGLIAGSIAGMSMIVYPAPEMASYAFWKLMEVLCIKGVETACVPKIPYFSELVYSLATAAVFHAALFEPHNLRPSYLKFIVKTTGQRLAHMNRFALQVLDIPQTTVFQTRYDPNPRFSSDSMKRFLQSASTTVVAT